MNNFLSQGQIIEKYQILSLLGQGAFGQVYKGLKLQNSDYVAIKVIELSRFSENDGLLGELVQSEIRALEIVKSDHVVGFFESFSDNKYCYIVMEFCDSGDLEQQLKNPKYKLTEQDALGIIKQILKGLRDLHSHYIIHRDLKLQNIMVHKNSSYKIADLGFCKVLQNPDQQSKLQLGTLFTMAPEIFNQQQYGLSSDMFSVGVILYQILYNRYPFTQRDYLSVQQPNINFQKNKIEVSYQTIDLLNQMLQFDPLKRITFQQLINHQAFEKPIFSLISKIQLQANMILFDDYEKFYLMKGKDIEQNNQNYPFNKVNVGQQQQQQQQKSQKKIKIIEILDIKENELSLEIDKINLKINEMFFFTNTIQEIFIYFNQPNLIALLCIKLQKLCEVILQLINQNQEKFQNLKSHEQDFQILEQQYREMATLYEGIQYQFYDVKDNLPLFEQDHLAYFMQQNISDNEFNNEFLRQLQEQLYNHNHKITVAFAHVILCYLFCQTKNPVTIQFDETTFNLKKSGEQYQNSQYLLQQLEELSQNFYNQQI
ncbi:unnamed protein product [Paramecium sonneborni]|uniref:Protein kinase domain-containing protein n=1 Tax=Paramecium sonneborni TaxID=65129 RepID=A0A8S1KDA2_9CILI|nr:unnamed protein product [Paramecium sonneborni]